MAKKGGYTIENIYQGGYSSFEPTALGTGRYPIQTGKLGLTLNPQTMNQLKEVSDKTSTGIKHVEMEALTPEFFDNIPKQQLKEINRLNKLTGVSVSVHGPVIDTTGVDPRRGGYSEADRVLAEKKVFQTLSRSNELNPDGNIPVNFHSAEGLPGSEFAPQRDKEGQRVYKKIIAVNKESGRLIPLEKEIKYYPGKGEQGGAGKKIYTPMENLDVLNESEWDNSLSQLFFNKERADELLHKNAPLIQNLYTDLNSGKYTLNDLPDAHKIAYGKVQEVKVYLDDIHKQANALFSKAYKYGNEEQKKILDNLSKKYSEESGLKEAQKNGGVIDPFREAQAMRNLLIGLQSPYKVGKELRNLTPEIYVPVEEFALEKSSETYGNAAFKAYREFGEKAPILTIENPPAGFALSTGEDVKALVDKSKEQFIKKAIEEGVNKNKAKKIADKLIGATLDVGHMNMLRKYDYSEEDVVKESSKMAPVLKHVHLSDNFGFEHTELPMGMGNVPFKKIMDKLGKKGYEAKKIIEAGQWWQQMGGAPLMATLETVGTPIYSGKAAPFWNQNVGFQQDYFGGYGLMLPQINYETFGAGFSQLPAELGGQRMGGTGSRMSGRPME